MKSYKKFKYMFYKDLWYSVILCLTILFVGSGRDYACLSPVGFYDSFRMLLTVDMLLLY